MKGHPRFGDALWFYPVSRTIHLNNHFGTRSGYGINIIYSTVTDFARFLGWSISQSRITAI